MPKQYLTTGAAALLTLFSVTTATAATIEKGVASYYHNSLHGNKTASGQEYNRNALSAAHKTLPLGTTVRVTDVTTGHSVVVHVNDRGPFVRGRIIDLSWRAARQLRITEKGTAKVKVEVISLPRRTRGV